jgi:hypothetical protein
MPADDREVPYHPSWIDRLSDWIDDLPGPAWLFYVLIICVSALLFNVAFWLDGTLPVGTFDPDPTSFAFYTFYWLGMYHYLSRVALRALQRFRPLLDVDETEYARIGYQLRVLPRGLGLVALPLGVILGLSSVLESLGAGDELNFQSVLGIALDVILTAFLSASLITLIIRSIRQLRLVSRLHERATHIDLLNLEPPHAFSDLTARTGVGVLLLLILSSLQVGLRTTLDVILTGSISMVAIGIFVIPLIGMRDRLEEEKKRRIQETNGLLRAATNRLQKGVRNEDYEGMNATEAAIGALMRQRELLGGIPTWPWDPRTLRGFASTLVMPIFIWLVTRILERFV